MTDKLHTLDVMIVVCRDGLRGTVKRDSLVWEPGGPVTLKAENLHGNTVWFLQVVVVEEATLQWDDEEGWIIESEIPPPDEVIEAQVEKARAAANTAKVFG